MADDEAPSARHVRTSHTSKFDAALKRLKAQGKSPTADVVADALVALRADLREEFAAGLAELARPSIDQEQLQKLKDAIQDVRSDHPARGDRVAMVFQQTVRLIETLQQPSKLDDPLISKLPALRPKFIPPR